MAWERNAVSEAHPGRDPGSSGRQMARPALRQSARADTCAMEITASVAGTARWVPECEPFPVPEADVVLTEVDAVGTGGATGRGTRDSAGAGC